MLFRCIPLSLVFAHAFISAPISAGMPQDSMAIADQGKALLLQSRLAEAEERFARWVEREAMNPDAHFYLARSRALQGRTELALAGFKQVVKLNPRRADALFEAGALIMEQKRYREAWVMVKRGLRIDPRDEHGLELAATLHLLLNSNVEAVRYWNLLNRPRLTDVRITSKSPVKPEPIAAEIDLQPGELISHSQLEKARWQLLQHEYIRGVDFTPLAVREPDEYSLDVQIRARNGFGSLSEFLFNSLSGVGFQTARLSYWNLAGKGMTVKSALRWKAAARFARFDLSAPRPFSLPVYSNASYGWGDESWQLTGASGGTPISFRLKTHEIGASVLVPLNRPGLALAFSLSGRKRSYQPAGSANPNTLAREALERSQGAVGFSLSPRFTILERHDPVGWNWRNHMQGTFDGVHILSPGSRNISRFSVTWENSFERTSARGLRTSFALKTHAGTVPARALLEDFFLMGIGPTADFQLRAHPLFRGGRMGSTPLASRFFLANFTFAQEIHTWKGVSLGVVGFADIAQLGDRYPGQSFTSTITDTGFGIDFGLSRFATRRFTLACARDWKRQRNVVYLSSAIR